MCRVVNLSLTAGACLILPRFDVPMVSARHPADTN
jgi:hypothetical protein